MRGQQRFVFAGMRAGRQKHGPRADGEFQHIELAGIGGKRRRIGLEASRHAHILRAERTKARGDFFILRKTRIESAHQYGRGRGRVTPAFGGARRHAGIHKTEPHAAFFRGENKVRPQIGIDEQTDIRLPVIEKTCDSRLRIDRRELMDRARRQTFRHQLRACHRAACDERGTAGLQQHFEQRQRREAFANARAMDPDERALRPWRARETETLLQTRAVFLAAHGALAQHELCDR